MAQLIGYDVSKLLRKTTTEYEAGKKKVYKCDKIKGLQDGKILHSMQNFKMAKKYPNTYVEIDVFMNSLLEQWNATFGVKKKPHKDILWNVARKQSAIYFGKGRHIPVVN